MLGKPVRMANNSEPRSTPQRLLGAPREQAAPPPQPASRSDSARPEKVTFICLDLSYKGKYFHPTKLGFLKIPKMKKKLYRFSRNTQDRPKPNCMDLAPLVEKV